MYKKLLLFFAVFILSFSVYAQTREELEQAAPLALQNQEFILYFQPVCKFDKNKICGAEVLSRWNYQGKLITPGKFIPLFEENGFIKQFDAYVLEHTLKHLQAWQKEGLQIGFLSVNISARELDNLAFPQHIKSLLENGSDISLRVRAHYGVDTALSLAVERNNPEVIKLLFTLSPKRSREIF